jgi:THO complex subunit 2
MSSMLSRYAPLKYTVLTLMINNPCIQYSTFLSKDVLAHALLNQLGKKSDKLKKGDTHYSQWFSSLSKFTASFYRRYPTTELKGLLHLLLARLSEGESLDLLILKELLSKMGGAETMLEISHEQVNGMAGGRVLRSEVMASSLPESIIKKAVTRLRDEFITSGTALPMLILIAQIRNKIIYSTDSSQLKLISYLYDTCQDVLMQFSDFLVGGETSMETIAAMMPPMRVLIKELGLSLPVAFTLVRPLVRAALSAGVNPGDAPSHLSSWHPLHEDMLSLVRSCLPEEVWTCVSPQIIVIFWSLSVYDLATPTARYEHEKKRLTLKLEQIQSKTTSSNLEMTSKMRRTEISRIETVIKELQEEMDAQRKHTDAMCKMLVAMKDQYFSHCRPEDVSKVADYLVQYCVLERITMSPTDAVFCSQFCYQLHKAETPFFSTVLYMDRVIKCILSMLFCCTEFEAGFIGYGISHMLVSVNKWIANKAIYDVEAMSKSCCTDLSGGVLEKISFIQFKAKYKVRKLLVLIYKLFHL